MLSLGDKKSQSRAARGAAREAEEAARRGGRGCRVADSALNAAWQHVPQHVAHVVDSQPAQIAL